MKQLAAIIMILMSMPLAAMSQGNDGSGMLDSMIAKYHTLSDNDTNKLKALYIISQEHYNADSVEFYSQKLIELSRKHSNGYMEARGNDFLWWAAMMKGDYPSAGRYASRSILIGDSIKNKTVLANGYYEMGCYYEDSKDMNAALDNYYTSLKIYQEMNSTINIKFMYDIIGLICIHELLFDEAEKCLNTAKELSQELGENTENYYNMYGSLYQTKYQHLQEKDPRLLKMAKDEFGKSLETARQQNDLYNIMVNETALASTMLIEINDGIVTGTESVSALKKIKELIDEACEIHETMDDNASTIDIYLCMANYNALTGDFDKAAELLNSLSDNEEDYTNAICNGWITYYSLMGNSDMVIKYQEKIIYNLMNSQKVDFAIKATRNIAQDELNKELKEREIEEARRETRGKMMISAVTAILIIVSLLGIYIYALLRKAKKMNGLLNRQNAELVQKQDEILSQRSDLVEKNEEIEQQKTILLRRNNDITASIHYASMIQKAAMPENELLAELFKDYFVIFRPLNMVAGDFYWAQRIGDYKIAVAADCTGHGVPGAFVSMLGISILNDLHSTVTSDPSAGHLLDKMRIRLKTALHQSDHAEDNHDGIDLAMVIINEKDQIMHYAGANRPLLRYRNGDITKFSATKMPIGIHINEYSDFQDNIIDIIPGDTLYMYSDGIVDQFGINEQGHRKKFSSARLLKLIKSIGSEPLAYQQKTIESYFDQWKGSHQQLDDIIVMGIRV